jgi:ribosomal 30S subunit maturation factor RimM
MARHRAKNRTTHSTELISLSCVRSSRSRNKPAQHRRVPRAQTNFVRFIISLSQLHKALRKFAPRASRRNIWQSSAFLLHHLNKEENMSRKYLLAASAATLLALTGATSVPSFAADNAQSADEFRTSKLVGSKVYNGANENIGSIEDIILKADGTMDEVVLSVGGFLGIGDKYVAVPFKDLQVSRDNGNLKITSNGTKESLKALPDYQFFKS